MKVITGRRSPAIALLACALSSCASLLDLVMPRGAEEMSPPAVYARWWQLTESCSGRSRDLASIRWYRTPGSSFIHDGEPAAGLSFGNRIVIAQEYLYDGPIVRHEMLHALLGDGGHPRSAFLGSCAALVYCFDKCARDGGPWTASSSYQLIAPDSLDVGVAVDLTSAPDGDRWLNEWVTVRNPRARAIVVVAPGPPRTPNTFEYQLWGPFGGIQGGLLAGDSSVLFFAPFESKRWLFEYRVGSTLSQYTVPIMIPPGTYGARVAYARKWSTMDTIVIAP